MKGIYSASIGKDTLDEAPFAYRGMEEIRAAVKDTAEIEEVLRPVYNFKAGNTEVRECWIASFRPAFWICLIIRT